MNITKQQLDDLNAVVKIELQPADYQDFAVVGGGDVEGWLVVFVGGALG